MVFAVPTGRHDLNPNQSRQIPITSAHLVNNAIENPHRLLPHLRPHQQTENSRGEYLHNPSLSALACRRWSMASQEICLKLSDRRAMHPQHQMRNSIGLARGMP